MRVLFVGARDKYGWLTHYSNLLNKHTDVISNCVFLKDTVGHPSDIIFKARKKTGFDMYQDDKIAMVIDFAKDADVIVFAAGVADGTDEPDYVANDTSSMIWGNIQWERLARKKKCMAFLPGSTSLRYNLDTYAQLFSSKGWRVITNQPDVYFNFALHYDYDNIDFVMPMIDTSATMYTGEIPTDDKQIRFLYRNEENLKPQENNEIFLRVGAFISNEFDEADYSFVVGCNNQTAINHLAQAKIHFDCLSPLSSITPASLEASMFGVVNCTGFDIASKVLYEQMLGVPVPWVVVRTEKELYEKTKQYIANPTLLAEHGERSRLWAAKYLDADNNMNALEQLVGVLSK